MLNRKAPALLAAIAFAAAGLAHAAPPTAPMNVTIVLTPGCKITTAPTDMTINYTADGTSTTNAASDASSVGVTCTGSLPYTMSFNAGTGSSTAAGITTYTYNDGTLDLNYSLTLGTGGTGNKTEQSYPITGTVAAGQWGKCAAASAGATCSNTNTHTLTVAY